MFKGTHGSLMIPPFQGNSHIYFDLYFFDGSIEKKGRVVTLTAIFTFISLYALSFYNISLFYLFLFFSRSRFAPPAVGQPTRPLASPCRCRRIRREDAHHVAPPARGYRHEAEPDQQSLSNSSRL